MRGNQPARIRQREVQVLVKGARKAGAKQVELRIGDCSAIIPLDEADLKSAHDNTDAELQEFEARHGQA
jgi:hypothetical protein